MGRVSGGNHKRSGGVFHEVSETRRAPVCFNLYVYIYIYFLRGSIFSPLLYFFFFLFSESVTQERIIYILGGNKVFFNDVEFASSNLNCDLFLEL